MVAISTQFVSWGEPPPVNLQPRTERCMRGNMSRRVGRAFRYPAGASSFLSISSASEQEGSAPGLRSR
jgi:hypothetical protein